MARPRHPDKHIEKAIRYAEGLGWTVRMSNAHGWGRLLCPLHTPEGCFVSVWSTPKNPENHARHIRRDVDICPHCRHVQTKPEGEEDGNQE
jgi:hypothetical protein